MMKHRITSLRPATAAIAAALVLSTAPALAQPADAPVDEAVQPAAPAAEPAPAPEAAPVEAVPTPALPQVQAAIPAPSQATEVVQQTPAAPAPTAAPVERVSQVAQRAAPAPAKPAAAPAVSSKPAEAAPLAPPVLATPQTGQAPSADLSPATEQAPVAPARTTLGPVDNNVLWGIGGAALLLVGGVSAFALARKKTPSEQRLEVAPVARAAPEPDRPVAVSFHAARTAKTATAAPRRATRKDGLNSDLEAMVAEPPSFENPFLTRKNRMRRAKYIMAHGMPEPLHSDAEPVAARVEEKQVKPQPAYRFRKAQSPQRLGWKPATT